MSDTPSPQRADGSIRWQTEPGRKIRRARQSSRPIARDPARPRTYGDCERAGLGTITPCPWISCRHHLALTVTIGGGIRHTWPGLEVDQMPATCSLAEAAAGPRTLQEVGRLVNLTRERVRQIETRALRTARTKVPDSEAP